MYPDWVLLAGLGIGLAWLCILTIIVFRERSLLRRLFPKNGGDIRERFKEVLDFLDSLTREIQILNKNIRDTNKEGLKHIQKSAILRYNPYEDGGGDQSFSMVLLDGKEDGVIITSLHARAGTRIYAKPIKSGKSELQLSKEEKEVLEKIND